VWYSKTTDNVLDSKTTNGSMHKRTCSLIHRVKASCKASRPTIGKLA